MDYYTQEISNMQNQTHQSAFEQMELSSLYEFLLEAHMARVMAILIKHSKQAPSIFVIEFNLDHKSISLINKTTLTHSN